MNSKKRLRLSVISWCIVYAFAFLSCVDQLELQPAKGVENGVAIQGELVLGTPSVLNVRIDQLYNFDVQSYAPISIKLVTLRDSAGRTMNIPLRTSKLYQHIFSPSDPIQVVEEQAYQIEVELLSGERIVSTFERLPPRPSEEVILSFKTGRAKIQDIRGEINDVPVVQFYATTTTNTESGETSKFLWRVERTYQITDGLDLENFVPKTCYVTVNLDFDRIHLLDGTALTSSTIDSFPLSRVLLNYEFAEGYYYSTYRRALTDGAFNYYSKIKEVVERTGTLFDTPAGLLPSNLTTVNDRKATNIYGYFMAYQQDTFRLYVSPEEVDNPILFCPPRGFPCPHVCCDCLFPDGSQLEKPDFWEE